jgi:LPS O-antigen subunit length determinant protein (WzzB/FepE family)
MVAKIKTSVLFEDRIKRFKSEFRNLDEFVNETLSIQTMLKTEVEKNLEELKIIESSDDEINIKYIKQNTITDNIQKDSMKIKELLDIVEKKSEHFTKELSRLIDEFCKCNNDISREDISNYVIDKIKS